MAQNRYADVETNLLVFADTRELQGLGADDNSTATVDNNNTILNGALDAASGEVEMAALAGGRYSEQDLLDLQTDVDMGLIGIVCNIAMYILYARRGREIPPARMRAWEAAQKRLDEIRDGSQVFRDDQVIEQGQLHVSVIGQAQRDELNLVSDEPFFPDRQVLTF